MQYQVKQKFWSFGRHFHIHDAADQKRFFIEGKAFSWGSKLSFQDLDGNELAFISQKLMSFKPRFEIYRGGELFAVMVKEFSWSGKKFSLDVPGPNDYTIDGSFWNYDYQFTRSGQTVAKVSRAVWALNDRYGVDIIDGEDDVAILAAVIVIDQVVQAEIVAATA